METQRAASGVKKSEGEARHRDGAEKASLPERILARPLRYRRSPDRSPRGVGENRRLQCPQGRFAGLN